ncbi:MAG: transglycosylase domain-containing protein, partial [Alphaproteobacteria bacterium]
MKRPSPPKRGPKTGPKRRSANKTQKAAASQKSKRAQNRAARSARAKAEGRRGPPKGPLRRIAYWSVVLALWLSAGLIGLGVIFAYDLPDTNGLTSVSRSPSVTLIAMDGREIATRGDLYGLPVRVEDLPKHVEQAVLATEDRRFYHHFGFDPIGFSRAMIANVRAGRLVQGGSTITQQLAKNVFLTADRTFTRKGKELLLAFWLEYRFSKQEILSLYLNRVYLGSGTYGIEAASHKYFGIEPQDLSLQQAAMIAGLLKAPSRYAPTADLKRAQGRAAQVIDNMVAAGFIDEATATKAKAKPARHTRVANLPPSRYYIDWVLDRLTDYIGHTTDDLTVETTLDLDVQSLSARTLKHWVDGEGKRLKAG